jgi:hypothetical protein
MDSEQTQVVFIGNSMMESRIDRTYIEQTAGLKAFLLDAGKVSAGPSMVPTWYLWLKNLVAPAKIKLTKVFIFFVDEQLTSTKFFIEPHDAKMTEAVLTRYEPVYDRLIRHKNTSLYTLVKDRIYQFYFRSDIQGAFRQVFSNLLMSAISTGPVERTKGEINTYLKNVGRRPAFDVIHDADFHPRDVPTTTTEEFSVALKNSFLAPIVQVAKDNNIPLCFVRIKRSPLQRREGDPKFQEYLRALEGYFKENNVCYIDESGDSSITDDLYKAPSDDHIGQPTAYTTLFVKKHLQPETK